MHILEAHNIVVGYPKANKTVLKQDLLTMNQGQLICLMGPNGVGKSTLMRSLAGLQSLISGEVRVTGKKINILTPKAQARIRSWVHTLQIISASVPVSEVIAMGRAPYTNWMGKLSSKDNEIIAAAISATNLKKLAENKFSQLSDGEKQKVMIARALAQDTPLMFLDEPTAYLDISNRISIMQLLKDLAHKQNKAILLSTHELQMAFEYADMIWLMGNEKNIFLDTPEQMIHKGLLHQVFTNLPQSFLSGSEKN